MSTEEEQNPERIDGQLPQLSDVIPDEVFEKIKKKDEGVPIYKMSNNFRLRITNHRKIFFNYTRDISCFSCGHDLHDSYTVSGNRGKTRCVPCAVKYHIIDEVPEEIKEFV